MKKISMIALGGILSVGAAFAGFQPDTPVQKPSSMGGFVGGSESIVTVKQVKEMRDDVPVVVQGNIVQRMGDEKYLFEDSTGSITVEIDNNKPILDLIVELGFTTSKGEAKRLIQGGGVKLDGDKISEIGFILKNLSGAVLQAGKRKFVKLVTK